MGRSSNRRVVGNGLLDYLMSMGSRSGFIKLLTTTVMLAALSCCGSSSSGSSSSTVVEGTLLDTTGAPVSDAEMYVYETNEGSLTDDVGQFSLESYKHLGMLSIFFRTGAFTNRVAVEAIPESTVTVRVRVVLDRETNAITLSDVSFDDSAPQPSGEVTPTAAPTTGAGTPVPRPTATPKPSNFDSAGNTSSFGIPTGLKGNITQGAAVWSGQCLSCHATEKTNRSYGQIKASIRVVPDMRSLQTTNQQIAHVTAYLNRNRR